MKNKKILGALSMLLVSAIMLSTASFAWFALNTSTRASGLHVEAYTDSLYLEIKKGDDTDYGTAIKYDEAASYLRLTTASLGSDNLAYVTFGQGVIVPAQDPFVQDTVYYEKVGNDYRIVDTSEFEAQGSDLTGLYLNPVFTIVTTKENKTGTFYQYDNKTHTYTSQTITNASAYGLYAINVEPLESGNYNGTGTYYKDVDGKLTNITHTLYEADTVDGYYTIDPDAVTTHSGDRDIHSGNDYYAQYELANGNFEYTHIGTISNGTRLDQYLFWGRAYSSDPDDAEESNSVSIITSDFADYYLVEEMQLRLAEGTVDAYNLRVEDVKIGGATNALHEAIRVLVVAQSAADQNLISYMLYSPETGIVHGNGRDNLFDKVLGDTNEVINVKVYIYFDGADPISSNATVAGGILNGQTVDIEFAINDHNYN